MLGLVIYRKFGLFLVMVVVIVLGRFWFWLMCWKMMLVKCLWCGLGVVEVVIEFSIMFSVRY